MDFLKVKGFVSDGFLKAKGFFPPTTHGIIRRIKKLTAPVTSPWNSEIFQKMQGNICREQKCEFHFSSVCSLDSAA